MKLHPLFWETVYAGDHIELKRHKIDRGFHIIDGKKPRVIFSITAKKAKEEELMVPWEIVYEDDLFYIGQHMDRKNFYLLLNKDKDIGFFQVILADDEGQEEELPGRWRIVYGNAALNLKRNERSGQYALYSRLTQNWLLLPREESKAVQQWETLYEDDAVRVRHHKKIEPLYVLINKLTGSLVILLANEDTLGIGADIGVVIPIPGGL